MIYLLLGTDLGDRMANLSRARELLEKELDGVENLSLDFSSCDYVSSAGLRVLLGTYKQLMATGGEMHLTNVGESFMDVLENTGLDTVFDIQ